MKNKIFFGKNRTVFSLLLFSFLVFSVFAVSSCRQMPVEYTESRELMNTYVKISLFSDSKKQAATAMEAAFSEIIRIEQLMSHTDIESQVFSLNQNGLLEAPDREVLLVIRTAKHYSRLSNGAFDITVLPLLELYKDSFSRKQRPPTDSEINETFEFIGHDKLSVSDNIIEFINPGMGITLGGIAKGYAIDRATAVLKEQGISSALVDAGGDIRTIGNKTGRHWTVALQNPRNKEEFITRLALDDHAVATSGDYERYYDSSKKAHHIMDPKTGKSATGLISVTIIADSCIDADALATTVFVMGQEKGMELIESIDDAETLLITQKKEILKSGGFGRFEI